jgi:hypothetical protein
MYSLISRWSVLLFIVSMGITGCGQEDVEESMPESKTTQDTTPTWEPVDSDYIDEDD